MSQSSKVKKRMTGKPIKSEYMSLNLIDIERQIAELQDKLFVLIQQRDALLEQNRLSDPPSYLI
jgi:hypothetical protein